jgi:probable F420-dependent oxidoreductase
LKEKLGRVGVWSWAGSGAPAEMLREGLPEIEELGFKTLWYPEAFARESLSAGALLLSWSKQLVIASGITNVYARDPIATVNGARSLEEAYPGRFLLGLGISHGMVIEMRGQEYKPPVPTMRAYLDGMDAAIYQGPPTERAPVVLAALGPLMLDLAAKRTLGAHPYFVPVEHTAYARERIGPQALLAVEQAVVLETDPTKARELGRAYCSFYLHAPSYRNNLLRLGWDEAEFLDGGSDKLVDALVAWGDLDAIAARVEAHFDAGADHVCIQALPSGDRLPVAQLRELAPALL